MLAGCLIPNLPTFSAFIIFISLFAIINCSYQYYSFNHANPDILYPVPKLAMMSLVSSHGPVAQPHLLVMCSPLMLPSVGATSHDKDSNISFEFLFIMTCHQKYQYRHGLVMVMKAKMLNQKNQGHWSGSLFSQNNFPKSLVFVQN